MSAVAPVRAGLTAAVAPCHVRTVERVIRVVSQRLGETHSLRDLASLAYLSPYYFHRVFRQATGVPPHRFLVALRIEAARRLLLTSELSVTEVSLEVGYRSLGTFTSQFSRMVGLSPRAFRKLARSGDRLEVFLGDAEETVNAVGAVQGRLTTDEAFEGLAFVGLFSSPLPDAPPLGCAIVSAPGPYRVTGPSEGVYHVLVAALPPSAEPTRAFLSGGEMLVGRSSGAILLRTDRDVIDADITLAPRRLTDPPILFLPSLGIAGRHYEFARNGAPQDGSREANVPVGASAGGRS